MRKILIAAATLTALGALSVLPAGAQGATVYLTAASGGLTITEPPTTAVIAGSAGGSVTGTLGTTTVLDLRGAAGYTVSIAGSALTPDATIAGPSAAVIPVSNMTVCSAAVAPVGASQDTATFNRNCSGGTPLTLSASPQNFVKINNTDLGVGLGYATSNTTFTTTVSINAATAVAGLYTGTFTQTVS